MCFLFAQSTLPNFKQNEFSVVRQHEEFIWLHDSFVENEEYAGYIVRAACTEDFTSPVVTILRRRITLS